MVYATKVDELDSDLENVSSFFAINIDGMQEATVNLIHLLMECLMIPYCQVSFLIPAGKHLYLSGINLGFHFGLIS